ncbi:MAG: O-antigen ligase family protein [Janthinobacterium lividum]
MTVIVTILLALTLVLAPIYAAQPDTPSALALPSSEWTSFLCAGIFLAILLAVFDSCRDSSPFAVRLASAEKAFLVLVGLGFLSIPVRLVVQHGTGYFGVMLRGWSLLAAYFALFALARRVSVNRISLYTLVAAGVAGSAIVADIGVQEYIVHLKAGERYWRIFATSTPDFLAGYFVVLLPVTVALFLEMPSTRGLTPLLRGAASLVLGVVLLLQLVALLTTGSRFGLISVVVSLLVFAAGVIFTTRQGLILPKATRGLLGILLFGAVLGGAVFAKPMLIRLLNFQDNSFAFRLWTWRGSLHMAAANPVLGTGIGTWVDLYPRYALAGFTRLAHNSYLQVADEIGIPALLVLVTTLVLLGISLIRGLKQASETEAADFLPADTRLLRCGLIAALAGGVVQNLIDSDWYVFFLGAAFWTLAGLASGQNTRNSDETRARIAAPFLIAVGSVAVVLAGLTAAQGIGAGYALAAQAQKTSDPGGAAESYGQARAWDPLNSVYASNQGYQIEYSRSGDLLSAETALQTAVALEPNSVNYRRLGIVQQAAGKNADAIASYQAGLRAEPNSLELLLKLARLSPTPDALIYYRRLSSLETSPVGTAPALGEAVEPSFAYGDAALGDESAQTEPGQAIDYYSRAARLLETYVTEGGSTNGQREELSGGQADPQADTDLQRLYSHVMTAWVKVAPADQQAALKQRQKEFGEKFDAVLRQSSKPGIL